jgi:hypothetical protein
MQINEIVQMMVNSADKKRQHNIPEDSLLSKELDKCDNIFPDSDALKGTNIESRDEDGKKDQGPSDLEIKTNRICFRRQYGAQCGCLFCSCLRHGNDCK